MRFNVTLIEPSGDRCAHFLHDVARYLVASLELLGHDCTLEKNRCDPAALNVLVGTHLLATSVDVDVVLGSARDYVVLQSEILSEVSLNGHALSERLERVVFPLLRGARAVWDSLESNVEALARVGIACDLLRFGYSPRLEEIAHKRERDIDFLFYGSVGAWRRSVLSKLEALGYRVRVEFDATSLFRNDLIARSEVILTLRHGDGMGHLPQGRIIYAVNNRCLVVGEGGEGQAPLEDVFVWTRDAAQVVDLCRATRARRDRRDLAQGFYETLRSRPMTSLMEPLVARLAAPLSVREPIPKPLEATATGAA
jgi:hypothetical protein